MRRRASYRHRHTHHWTSSAHCAHGRLNGADPTTLAAALQATPRPSRKKHAPAMGALNEYCDNAQKSFVHTQTHTPMDIFCTLYTWPAQRCRPHHTCSSATSNPKTFEKKACA